MLAGHKPAGIESFVVRVDIAITAGKLIFRHRLVELIQHVRATRG